MNGSDHLDLLRNYQEYLSSAYNYSMIILLFFYFFHLLIFFPCFWYVYRQNQENDKEIPVFPVLKQIFAITKFHTFFSYFFLPAMLILPFGLKISESFGPVLILFLIYIFLFFQFALASLTITFAQNILLFGLAFQRFFIYVFPNSEKYLSPKSKNFEKIMKLFYFLLSIYNFFSLILILFFLFFKRARNVNSTILDKIYLFCLYPYILFDLLFLITAIFYFIIIYKIRQFIKLTLNISSHPERRIFYQIFIIFVIKLMTIPFMINYYLKSPQGLPNPIKIWLTFFATDSHLNSLIVEISYLTSNRKNWETLTSFRFRCWKFGQRIEVAPERCQDFTEQGI